VLPMLKQVHSSRYPFSSSPQLPPSRKHNFNLIFFFRNTDKQEDETLGVKSTKNGKRKITNVLREAARALRIAEKQNPRS